MFKTILIILALQQGFTNAYPLRQQQAYSKKTNENWGLISPNQNSSYNLNSYQWPSLKVIYESGKYSLSIIMLFIIINYTVIIFKLCYICYIIIDILIIQAVILKYKKNK